MLYIWTNCAHLFPILLDKGKMRSTGVSEWAIAAWGISFSEKRISQRAFIAVKKKKKTVHELLKRHWGVSIVVYSLIWTNPFDDLSSRANREWINVVSTRSTGFRTNKRYAILLELPVTPAFDIWYILADILRCPHNEVKISQRWSLIRDGNYQLYWCWKVKLKVGCYNLMLAAKVECWGLKLIFGSLSWIINFECWNVKLKVECYNSMSAAQVECWGLKLIFGGDWTPYLPTDTVLYDGDSG